MKTYRFPIILAASLLALVGCGGGNSENNTSSNVPGDSDAEIGNSSTVVGSSDNNNSSVAVNSSSINVNSSSNAGSQNPGSSSNAGGSSSIDDSKAIIKEETNITPLLISGFKEEISYYITECDVNKTVVFFIGFVNELSFII